MGTLKVSNIITTLFFSFVTVCGYTQEQSAATNSQDYWKYSDTPLLGQVIPVNQINLQKGVHLLDIETIGKQYEGMTNPFDTMGLGSFSTDNKDALIRLRYAFALARYTYVGFTTGFASRWEAELYDDSGITDPEIFIGHHIPWKNGDFRLALTFSPSLGASSVERDVDVNKEKAKGNFYRGGWSVRPEAALTIRSGKVIFGAEASYLYLGERTHNESVILTPDAANDSTTVTGLSQHFLGSNSGDQSLLDKIDNVQSKITGGHTWAVKGLVEVPDWQRLGAEFIYGQVSSSSRENDFGKIVENDGGAFQEVRVYGRYKYNDNMSLTPLVSWMPSLPSVRGQDRLDSTSNVWGVQLTFRSKFAL